MSTCGAKTTDGGSCQNPRGPAGKCAAGHTCVAPAAAGQAPAKAGASAAAADPLGSATPPPERSAADVKDMQRVTFRSDRFAFAHEGRTHEVTRTEARSFRSDHDLSCSCGDDLGTSDRQVSATDLVTNHAGRLVHASEKAAAAAQVAEDVDAVKAAFDSGDEVSVRQVEFVQESYRSAMDYAEKAEAAGGRGFEADIAKTEQTRMFTAIEMAVHSHTGKRMRGDVFAHFKRMREVGLLTHDED